MSDVLYRWPSSATVGRTVPKTKFYEHGNVRTVLREKFVGEIQRVTWSYKLSGATTMLKGSDAVPEIQVFTIETKGADVDEDLLAAIDGSVHFPIIFEVASSLESGKRVRTVAAHKQLSGRSPRVGTYFTTAWLAAESARTPLPTALDLPTLYEAILATLLPVHMRRGESVSDASERIKTLKRIEREIGTLERRLRAEPQLNRKVQLRRELMNRQAALAELA